MATESKKPKAKKAKVLIEKFMKLSIPAKRIWEELPGVVGEKESSINEWTDKTFIAATAGKYVLIQLNECDETFAIEKDVLKELLEQVE